MSRLPRVVVFTPPIFHLYPQRDFLLHRLRSRTTCLQSPRLENPKSLLRPNMPLPINLQNNAGYGNLPARLLREYVASMHRHNARCKPWSSILDNISQQWATNRESSVHTTARREASRREASRRDGLTGAITLNFPVFFSKRQYPAFDLHMRMRGPWCVGHEENREQKGSSSALGCRVRRQLQDMTSS